MELFIDKIDHELHNALFVAHDEKKTRVIWNKIRESKFVLKTASEVVNQDDNLVFKAPTIGYLALKYPELIDEISYKRFVRRVVSNEGIANNVINTGEGFTESFLAIVLKNNDIDFEDYQNDFIVRQAMKLGYSLKNEYNVINYRGIPVAGDIAAKMEVNGLFVEFSKSEEEIFANKESKNVVKDNIRDVYDIRYWLLRNHNFDLTTKKFLTERLYPNLNEFNAIIEYILNDLARAYNLSISSFELLNMEDDEIKLLNVNGENLFKEVIFLRLLIKMHDRSITLELLRD